MSDARNPDLLHSTTSIVVAQQATGTLGPAEVPAFIRSVYQTLCEIDGGLVTGGEAEFEAGPPRAPAVPVDQSITQEYIVCLEDGKQLRMLKRYLMSQYGMTPDDYRRRWGLPGDYPMMAPAVSEQRRIAALRNGLGKGSPARGDS